MKKQLLVILISLCQTFIIAQEIELDFYPPYNTSVTQEKYNYLYMDCLFVKEFARGLGIGEKLVRQIEMEGKKLNCHLIQWQTPDFNTPAIRFYERLGATSKSKERFFLTI